MGKAESLEKTRGEFDIEVENMRRLDETLSACSDQKAATEMLIAQSREAGAELEAALKMAKSNVESFENVREAVRFLVQRSSIATPEPKADQDAVGEPAVGAVAVSKEGEPGGASR